MKAFSLSLILSLLVYLIDAAAASESGATLVAADAAFARGEYGAAVQLLTRVIDADPSSPLLYTKRAAAYIVLRQQAQALRDLNLAVEVDVTFVQGYTHRGKLQRQMCNTAAAERDFNKVLELRPGHKAALKELESTLRVRQLLEEALAHHAAANLVAARASLAALFEDAQDCVEGILLESTMFMDESHYEEVVAATGRALKSEPNNMRALVMRGRAYFRLNDHDMAKRHFGEALKYDPDYSPATKAFRLVKDFDKKRQKGEAAAAAHDWTESELQFAAALHVDAEHRAGNAVLWLGLCTARHHLRRWDESVEACNNVLILESNHVGAKAQILTTLLAAERWQEAATKGREFVQSHQQDHTLHGLFREAEKQLKISLRKDHYKTLGLDKSASEQDIKRAYRGMAKIHHPDKVSLEQRPAAEAKFREIAEAYEILSDPERRGRFDNGEDDNPQQQQQQQQQGHPFFHQGQGHQQQYHFQWGG